MLAGAVRVGDVAKEFEIPVRMTAIGVATLVVLHLATSARAQAGPASVEILPVHGQVYLLASASGNALLQVGAQGVLVVDTMREQDADGLLAAIQ